MNQLFKDKKYWKDMGIILLLGIFINVACFFMCSITGHCATIDTTLYFPMSQGDGEITQDVMSLIIQNDSNLHWTEHDDETYYKFVCASQQYNSQGIGGTISIICVYSLTEPKAELNSDNHTFYIENLATSINGAQCYELTRYGNGTITVNNRSGWLSNGKLNYAMQSSQYHPNTNSNRYSYFSNFTLFFYQNNDVCLIGPSINVGEFSDLPPLESILNNLTDTYTPDFSPVYPNIDSNKTDIENEKSFFDTLSQGITQNFNNLGSNLQKFFNKIQEKLTNVSNAISTNIHNGFATLMQNIRDFFGPKLDKIIELLTALVNDDESDVIETWENTQLYTDFDQFSQTVENGFGVWQDTSEPNTYKIAFHVEQIPLLHCDEVQYIDLGLFSPVIPYIRSIMWALMVYSVFYTVIDSIANYLNGGDE